MQKYVWNMVAYWFWSPNNCGIVFQQDGGELEYKLVNIILWLLQ